MPFPNPSTQFKPGQSGNVAGSSRKQRLTSALLSYLDEDPKRAEALIKVGYKEALSGNYQFWRHLFDRVDGPVIDPREAEGLTDGAGDESQRLAIPEADDRYEAPAGRRPARADRRKAKAKGTGGDVPQGTPGERTGGDG